MWPFNSVPKMKDSDFFRGLIDWHSHILPGVDDGIRTMSESLAVLKSYEELGVKKLWLTPHIMEDCPNTPEKLNERFEELKSVYHGPIELRLAAEHMLDSLFEERLEKDILMPIGEEKEHVLVETSYVNPPYAMQEMIDGLKKKGYVPVLAHPERYRYMEKEDYLKWKEEGLLFQMNFMSLLGGYGETARKKSEWLLKEGMINMVGSDLHRKIMLDNALIRSPKKKELLKLVTDISHNPAIR
ncbi:MAG: capsular biosynthesis protein [Bacteroidales bacterium]|nr:capsular biosynthesis protein [Bacteroidales bacterium]